MPYMGMMACNPKGSDAGEKNEPFGIKDRADTMRLGKYDLYDLRSRYESALHQLRMLKIRESRELNTTESTTQQLLVEEMDWVDRYIAKKEAEEAAYSDPTLPTLGDPNEFI